MTLKELHQANLLKTAIEEKKAQIQALERGKIKSITIRQFDDNDCSQTDFEIVAGIPRATLKEVMTKVFKADLQNLEHRFENLLKIETQPLS